MWYKKLFLIGHLIACLSLFACGKEEWKTPGDDADKAVAIVNYSKIYLSELQDEIDHFTSKYGISLSEKKERYQKVAMNILDEIILRKIYIQEAERLGITVLEEELEARLKNIKEDHIQEDLRRVIESKNVDYSKWYTQIKKNMLLEKLIDQEVKAKIVVKESEIQSYYKEHSKDYILPDRVQAFQIVLNNELEAEAIYNTLQEGADFFKLAKNNSVSPDGIHGGDLGFFSRGQMPKEFDDAVFSLKVGEFSKVVLSPYGYHIFKVIKKKRAGIMNFNDAREKIREKLAKEKEKEEFLSWVNKLKENSVVVIKKEVLSNLDQKI